MFTLFLLFQKDCSPFGVYTMLPRVHPMLSYVNVVIDNILFLQTFSFHTFLCHSYLIMDLQSFIPMHVSTSNATPLSKSPLYKCENKNNDFLMAIIIHKCNTAIFIPSYLHIGSILNREGINISFGVRGYHTFM